MALETGVPRICRAILSIFLPEVRSGHSKNAALMEAELGVDSKVSGLLEREEVLGRELLALLEPLEDEFRLFLRVDLFRDFLGDAAALHPDAVNDLVVIVDLADVLDVLAVLLVREHFRLDELLLRPIGLPAEVVALLV